MATQTENLVTVITLYRCSPSDDMFEEMLEVVVLGLVEVTNEDTANNTVSVLTYKTQFIYTQGNNNPL